MAQIACRLAWACDCGRTAAYGHCGAEPTAQVFRPACTRKCEAALPGLEGMAHQQAAITDLRDGAAHTAVVAGWMPVVGEEGC